MAKNVISRPRQRPRTWDQGQDKASDTAVCPQGSLRMRISPRRHMTSSSGSSAVVVVVSGFYLPISGIEIGCNFPPLLGSGSPPNFWLNFPHPFWATFPSRESFVKSVDWKIGGVKIGGSFVKGVVCPWKIGGKFWFTTESKLPHFSLGASCAHQV